MKLVGISLPDQFTYADSSDGGPPIATPIGLDDLVELRTLVSGNIVQELRNRDLARIVDGVFVPHWSIILDRLAALDDLKDSFRKAGL